MYFFGEPASHGFLAAGASEVDGDSIFEEKQGGEALYLQLGLQILAGIEVDLGKADWLRKEIPLGSEVLSSDASYIQTGASFLQCPHQGV